ncbi:peptidylprolyl isomerase [Aestuariibius sp. HNIBRBA575]|uniref:peptidylprolyl isomerase n=1 Tax=Aestuariibius sp. HNIBRBA575 TaxID=3233343 RepID=UPI0034A0E8D1
MSAALFPEITVNGTTISAASIAAEAQNHNAPKAKPGLAWRRAARALAIRQVLIEEARKRGLNPQQQELEPGKFETVEDAQIRELLAEVVNVSADDDATLQATYDKDPDSYRAPSLYQPSHILFAADPGDAETRQAAYNRAIQVLDDLKENPRRFTDFARSESACASKDADGQLGQLTSGDTVPEFERAMDAAPVGAIYDQLVDTRFGIHILRVDERAEGAVLPFETVLPRLQAASEKANWAKAAHDYVSGLLDQADIAGIDLAAVA